MCNEISNKSSIKAATRQLGFTAGKLAILASLTLGSMVGLAPAPAMADGGEFLGLVGGGLAGGLIGNAFGHGRGRTAATAGGAVLGAVVGDSYGYSVDRSRHGGYYDGGYSRGSYYQPSTVYYSQPAPQRVYYVPSYEERVQTVAVVPARTTYVVDNSVPASTSYCREYDQGVTIGGRTQSSYGTACQQPDGSWKIQ